MRNRDRFTPQELVDQFPFLEDIGWSATNIGRLFAMGLLDGKSKGRKVLISLQSVKRLLKLRNDIGHVDLSQLD